jgi:hypothetical protein
MMSENEVKEALKEALKEWLNERFAEVGRWTFRGALVAALGALTYFILQMNGWHR